MTGLGIDLCEVKRIKAAILANDGFLLRYYTAEERATWKRGKSGRPERGAMFAAKEAFLKRWAWGFPAG